MELLIYQYKMKKEQQLILFLFLASLVLFQNEGSCRNKTGHSILNSTNTYATIVGTKITIEAARWYQVNNTSNGLNGLFDGITDKKVETGFGKMLERYDAYYPLNTREEITIQS